MKTMNIKLSSISDVKELVRIVTAFSGDVDLRSGNYITDAKSILGLLAMNRRKPIEVIVDRDENADELFSKLEKFKV
ncbi:MAG: HPr family phosphocarrier protein [Ruminococcaceae bacterium]|nr:HPr family phosphocarrier protein [Oscillospiraceae bacterium]